MNKCTRVWPNKKFQNFIKKNERNREMYTPFLPVGQFLINLPPLVKFLYTEIIKEKDTDIYFIKYFFNQVIYFGFFFNITEIKIFFVFIQD